MSTLCPNGHLVRASGWLHQGRKGLLLLANRAAARPLAGTGIGMRTLATDGESPAVAQATETANVHQALDIRGKLTAEVAFHLIVLFDFFAKLVYFFGGKIINATGPINTGRAENFHSGRPANAINVGQRDISALPTRQVNTSNSGHSSSPEKLALALLVPGVFANDP